MSRSVFAFFIVAVVYLLSSPLEVRAGDEVCYGENEYWNDCGSPCPMTCEYPEARACVKRCDPGCHCKPGYVLRRDGKCVLHCDCF